MSANWKSALIRCSGCPTGPQIKHAGTVELGQPPCSTLLKAQANNPLTLNLLQAHINAHAIPPEPKQVEPKPEDDGIGPLRTQPLGKRTPKGKYFAADEKCLPFAVRLTIGRVLSGTLPSSSGFVSNCLKANMEQNFELAGQVKKLYDMETYDALKQVDPESNLNARAHEILINTAVLNGKRYDFVMQRAKDNIELHNIFFSELVQLKSLEKRLRQLKSSEKRLTLSIWIPLRSS